MQVCTSSQTTTPTSHHSVYYRPDVLPAAQLTASKHWRQDNLLIKLKAKFHFTFKVAKNCNFIIYHDSGRLEWGFLYPIEHKKIHHFRDALPSQSLGWYWRDETEQNNMKEHKNANKIKCFKASQKQQLNQCGNVLRTAHLCAYHFA